MDAEKRRAAVLSSLRASGAPISAASLASKYSVSRQIIVGDVALLRASGELITATPRGYVLGPGKGGYIGTVACVHGMDGMEKELNIMVDNGCTVLNVIVEHPVYGQITGELHLSSRYDVGQFMEKLTGEAAQPLSALTGGIHLHTLACPDRAVFDRTCDELTAAGLMYQSDKD
jgi:transcriptional regulator of NAD metabolism